MVEPGNYNVLSYLDGNGVNTCPSVAPGDVVILTDVGVVCLTVSSFWLCWLNSVNRSNSGALKEATTSISIRDMLNPRGTICSFLPSPAMQPGCGNSSIKEIADPTCKPQYSTVDTLPTIYLVFCPPTILGSRGLTQEMSRAVAVRYYSHSYNPRHQRCFHTIF